MGFSASTGRDSGSVLDDRSREIFRRIVESYLETGEPLGSRNLSRLLPISLSPASVRNVMSDLEELGLIYSPHISAGRLPTQSGLRFFVDAFMQVGDLSAEERANIDRQIRPADRDQPMESLMAEASRMLSGVSRGAGIVITTKSDPVLKHVEFIRLEPTKALAVLVGDHNQVENRIIELPAGVTSSQLTEAANFLNAHLSGQTLPELRGQLKTLKDQVQGELHALSQELVERGLAVWSGDSEEGKPTQLIVRGRANLLEGLADVADLDRLRLLFDDLEKKDSLIEILDLAEKGPGVRIFIGSENKLFSLSGSSLIVAPYRDGEDRIVGAVGVIGPTRLNYSRIVPMVDYTAQLLARLSR
ncbi:MULTISPECIES: heat-inducible transcriptional repressor HrcA [Neorhizobium]|jgi:heat-inducible transcriptional repressor|uniref:Heat-inducible transcription repressor HrcA n=1 Tax=Neorhizobium galegae bv. officinalis TaxID=323656 RepID=A0A0T7FJX0_NEOGA|nr:MULTISPECIES: heat-inducible transcriptional repressor HrcA [Neorhizobium]CDZ62116.1 Heat-inducible transcription repressor HrcA [Neorhizobium galegae bv. orientalis]KAA9385750.1 heat-inducible transcriptional repressor HrcA [Neorhizobium galegae]KAB1112520.1 heat-inducible transcriptional repressor HrcA [Neorhizobium galegae]KAB1120181.1 heat-inducible transcriptional repressor HrcA [Neorhizobium galegae]MCM2497309.1 heat-inducible transcriptional repressor HrcA [Neorhizobium galegae]